jgi:hypothetical protein
MSNKFTVDYFIDKFERLPDSEWCTGTLYNGRGQKCAVGHCPYSDEYKFEEREALWTLFKAILVMPAQVNDAHSPKYQQPSPKARVLAALRDIKSLT